MRSTKFAHLRRQTGKPARIWYYLALLAAVWVMFQLLGSVEGGRP